MFRANPSLRLSLSDPALPNSKRVVITGGEGALGRAMASSLLELGWDVFAPGHAELDVACEKSVDVYFKNATRLDALIHSAGVLEDRSLSKMEPSAWDRVMECHLSGAWRCSRAAIPLLENAGGGHLVFIGSWSAFKGPIGQANYSAAKAGMIGLSHSLAKECGAKNIRCNVILPGYIPTKMNQHLSEERVEEIREGHVLGRFNTLEEAARWVAFLVQTENVSGQVFQLDSRVRRWV